MQVLPAQQPGVNPQGAPASPRRKNPKSTVHTLRPEGYKLGWRDVALWKRRLRDCLELSATDMLVGLAVADAMHLKTNELWKSMAAVAADAHCSERHARRVVRRLEELGFLTVAMQSHGRKVNAYSLNLGRKRAPKPPAGSRPAVAKKPMKSKANYPQPVDSENQVVENVEKNEPTRTFSTPQPGHGCPPDRGDFIPLSKSSSLEKPGMPEAPTKAPRLLDFRIFMGPLFKFTADRAWQHRENLMHTFRPWPGMEEALRMDGLTEATASP